MLSSLSRFFNELVCIDDFYSSHICLLSAMESVTRYSSCAIVSSFSMPNDVLAIHSCWLGQFGPSTNVLGDPSFNHEKLFQYLSSLNAEDKPILPRFHNNTVLQSKHGVIRSVLSV